jgi:hypothetical protein
MGDAALDGAAGRNQRLSGDQAAKDTRPPVAGTEPAKEIAVEPLQIEPPEEAVEV